MILALDQGTSSSRALLFDKNGQLLGLEQQEFQQYYPQEAWVEHDAEEIWRSQLQVAQRLIEKMQISPQAIQAIGITNQRETTILWDKKTGRPVHRAIVWQDRRTASYCEELKQAGHADYLRQQTGLLADAYFSATKIRWILEHVPQAKALAEKEQLCFGTVDSWLLWKLTNGKVHKTDPSNASRTLLYNLHTGEWDPKLLDIFGIPAHILPEISASSGLFGHTDSSLFGAEISITGIAGDQQAALFGQGCWQAGSVKNTYGTGCFMLMNTGDQPQSSNSGLLTTVAWEIDGQRTYALEGAVFVAGAAIQWLRDSLRILDSAKDSSYFAQQVEDTNGVYFVPAFAGLGAPYWDMYARGAILGLSRSSTKAHIVRAALESLAYQSKDLLLAMQQDAQLPLVQLKVDGGASANDFLMQFQSDILDAELLRPSLQETTAAGAAYLAGLGAKVWTKSDIQGFLAKQAQSFQPNMPAADREKRYARWLKAVSRTRNWAEE
ncbi:glycerol kinase [Saprospira grandis DSM 2844]|uniref:Glycerol kinase n=1 Tax=Saprospira grandis DSM 2844 TaxID=694433 RepID=J0XZV9_9BACT|nr:glycerol kinase GlpK [Saprospira grandis]EJF54771.1 glycerol kinase [Saprospira grandis DSM 2844]